MNCLSEVMWLEIRGSDPDIRLLPEYDILEWHRMHKETGHADTKASRIWHVNMAADVFGLFALMTLSVQRDPTFESWIAALSNITYIGLTKESV